ncbi:hypothetical protein H4R19_000893 [Coemansia spiralis]|nr:hypothetical protein H4R19_000893 [Coemansia spiralis]
MQSRTSVETRTDGGISRRMDSSPEAGGLVLGEFGEDGGEIAEDEEGGTARPQRIRPARPRPSGAIERVADYDQAASDGQAVSDGHVRARAARVRRESTQSVPVYEQLERGRRGLPARSSGDAGSDGYMHSEEGEGSEGLSYEYTDEEGVATQGELDADGELDAVYLKRNADFHALFRSIPINELLIDDYRCALQRDILVQGRLYLTENYVCFYSNIFGWVTSVVIAFDEIVSLEKRMTALIIPNAIQVSTLHAKHFFGSFIYRDSAYNQLYDLWAMGRNEKNAGLPEIGHAEGGGDAAGDVSRNRADIVNAYQSLSEDEDGDRGSRLAARSDASGSGDEDGRGSRTSGSESHGSLAELRSGSASGSESDDSRSSLDGGGWPHDKKMHPGADIAEGSDVPALSDSGRLPSQLRQLSGDVSPPSANDASSVAPHTATESVIDTPAAGSTVDVSHALAQLVPGTKSNGSTATLLVPERLLERIPADVKDASAPARGDGARAHREPLAPMQLHPPTTCACGTDGRAAHYRQEILDAVFPLSLPLLFRVVFSAQVPADVERAYLPRSQVDAEELAGSCTRRLVECGNSDVSTEGWVPDPDGSGKEMCIYSYEKPLNFSIGPKSTTVEDIFRIVAMDFDRAVVVEQVVRTPNVPSGTAFSVKIRHCLSWAGGPSNQPPGGWSRYVMSFEMEWTKSSWFKGPIDKGSAESNKQASELLEKYIREWIAAHPNMEVKAQASVAAGRALARAAGGGAAHKRHRKGPRKSRREESPRGLRMEELVGSTSEYQSQQGRLPHPPSVQYEQLASGHGAPPGRRLSAAGEAPAAAAAATGGEPPRGAKAWPMVPGTVPLPGPVVALALSLALALLVVLWRTPGRSGLPASHTEQMAQIQASLDALAQQVADLSRQLRVLVELQSRPT